jgi:hypothetical protein
MLFREWFAVFFTLCFIVLVLLVETFPSRLTDRDCACEGASTLKLRVTVLGAVERPGVYEVDVGSSLKSVVDQAGLKKEAERKGLYLKKRVLSSCTLNIPEKDKEKTRKKRRV